MLAGDQVRLEIGEAFGLPLKMRLKFRMSVTRSKFHQPSGLGAKFSTTQQAEGPIRSQELKYFGGCSRPASLLVQPGRKAWD